MTVADASIPPTLAVARATSLFSISARQWLILLTVQISTLLFGMTITLANVVLPQIRGALSATQDEIAWVITLNLVATAVATPMTGWLSSRLGWRNVMFFCVGGFTACSFLCGIADSLETLVLYRVGQGLFGAPIMPLGQGIVLATFPRQLHATVMVIWGAGSVMGPVFGPILGSMIAEAYNWRYAFFMIVPPGLVALLCIWFALSEHRKGTATRLNWIGFLVVVPFSRRYPRLAVSSGLLAQAVAGWAMAQLDINLSSFDVFWTNALQGFGFGLAYTPMTVLAFATLPAHQLTEGSGVFTLVRNFGSSLYISITVVLLVRSTTANYARMTEFVTPFNKTLAFPGLPGAWSLDTASGLLRLAGEIQRQAAMIGYINAFHLLALTAAVATPLVWLMRGNPRLRLRSANSIA